MKIQVHSLPLLTTPEQFAGASVVVVDVLRATTTMLRALQSGAEAVIPCAEVDDAVRIAAEFPAAVLGGERGGKRIDGFRLGNSPAEYTPSVVGGKVVVMTTTNGTRAMQQCRSAQQVLIGGFVNFSCLLSELAANPHIAVLCAGTDGKVTREDVLFAGALVSGLVQQSNSAVELDDEAELARAAWRATASGDDSAHRLLDALRHSRGGRNLVKLGFDEDIVFASQIDSVPLLGELLLPAWRVVAR